MSSGLTSAMNAATSALSVRQTQLSIVSTNLANTDDSTYHLRTTNVGTYNVSGDGTSSGVYVTSVTRAYNLSLETSLNAAIANNSYCKDYYSQLTQVQDILGADNTSYLNDAMVDFSDKLTALATNPQSTSYRSALLSSAGTLCTVINSEYKELVAQKDAIFKSSASGTITGSLSTQVSEANDILTQINDLNDAIRQTETTDSSTQQALDLRDKRDALVQKLSAYGDFSFVEEDNGQYTVTMNLASGSSITMIDGTGDTSALTNTLTVFADGSGNPQISVSSAPATALTLTDETGSLKAQLDSYDYINDVMTDLYNYASDFATQINTLQASGYDLDGNTGVTTKIFNVAIASSGIITVDSGIADSPRKLAVASAADSAGDGSNATAMWTVLNDSDTHTYNNTTLLEYADQILTSTSQDVASASSNAENSASIQSMFEDEIASFSGVSTDEELVSMLEYQRAYQAAAKVVTAIDQMLQTIINM